MARRFPRLVKAAARMPWLRELAFALPLSAGSRRMPASDAFRAVDDLATTTAFEETFEHTRIAVFRTRHRRSGDGGVWRSRLDPSETFTRSVRSSGSTPGGSISKAGVTYRCGSIQSVSRSSSWKAARARTSRSADEVLGAIDAARSLVLGDLRIRTERARSEHPSFVHLRGEDFGRRSFRARATARARPACRTRWDRRRRRSVPSPAP